MSLMISDNGLGEVDRLLKETAAPTDSKTFALQKSTLSVSLYPTVNGAFHAWQQLKGVLHSNPYNEPNWLEAWQSTLGDAQGITPVMAVITHEGDVQALLPLGLQRKAGAKALFFLGHQNGNQNTGIWAADFYERVADTEISFILQEIASGSGADLLCLTNIPEVWHGRRHPLVQDTPVDSPSPIYTRQLPADFEALFRETHSKSSRKNLLRKQRHLEAVPGYFIARAETHEDVTRALSAYHSQRTLRASESGVPNAFSSDAGSGFLRKVAGLNDSPASSGTLSIWYLEANGQIRATSLCLEHGETLYFYSNSVAHDDLLANSPGLVLLKEVIRKACDAHIKALDLGLGEERYKTAWTDPVALKDVYLPATLKGRTSLAFVRQLGKLKTGIRNSSLIWPQVRRARKLIAGLKRQ